MSEKNEAVPEPSGLSKRNKPDTDGEFYVPDYVMRDFGETEEASSPSRRTSGRRSGPEFLF